MSSFPTSLNAAAFFRDLYNPTGQKFYYDVGDSIKGITIANPLHDGLREISPVKWNGHFQGIANTDFWGYANRQGTLGTNNMISPAGATYGETAIAVLTELAGESPVKWAEAIWTVAPSSTMGDNYTDTAKLLRMPGRDRIIYRHGGNVSARMVYMNHARNFANVTIRGRRASTTIANTSYVKPTATNQIAFSDVSCGQHDTNDANCIALSAAVTGGSADAWPLLGVRFLTDEANGVCYCTTSHGGWTTGDHIYEGFYTTAGLARFMVAQGVPTHIDLLLGQNQNTGVRAGNATNLSSGGSEYQKFQADLLAVMAKYEAAMVIACGILGVPFVRPRWLLRVMYKTGYSTTYADQMATAVFAIAAADSQVSVINLYRLTGGDNMQTGVYTSDGVHPSADGAKYLTAVTHWEGARALMAAGSSGSGTVTRNQGSRTLGGTAMRIAEPWSYSTPAGTADGAQAAYPTLTKTDYESLDEIKALAGAVFIPLNPIGGPQRMDLQQVANAAAGQTSRGLYYHVSKRTTDAGDVKYTLNYIGEMTNSFGAIAVGDGRTGHVYAVSGEFTSSDWLDQQTGQSPGLVGTGAAGSPVGLSIPDCANAEGILVLLAKGASGGATGISHRHRCWA